MNEYENAIIVSDDILGSTNSSYIDEFSITGRHKKLDIFYLSHSFFILTKGTTLDISNKKRLINQTLKDIENMYTDVGGIDMNYDEHKELCRKSWEDEYDYLCIDRYKKRDQA